jgi:hypothetical protein
MTNAPKIPTSYERRPAYIGEPTCPACGCVALPTSEHCSLHRHFPPSKGGAR